MGKVLLFYLDLPQSLQVQLVVDLEIKNPKFDSRLRTERAPTCRQLLNAAIDFTRHAFGQPPGMRPR